MVDRPLIDRRAPDPCRPEPVAAFVPEGARIYAIGDSHGCIEKLVRLHAAILEDSARADAAGPAAERRVAVYLGDYIDRGPGAREILDLLIEQPLAGFESVHLLGNHEAFMLRFLDEAGDPMAWLLNGGDATLRGYGVDSGDSSMDLSGGEGLRAELARRVPRTHRAFLRTLGLHHVEGDYLFVHAGIRPGVAIEAQDPEDLIWIREPFLASSADHGKVVVHGHTPGQDPVIRANRIGIDTGACYGGRLTALVLEESRRRFVQV